MDRGFSLLLYYDKSVPPNEEEIREQLESNDVAEKISGLKTLISLQLQSEQMPRLLMTVIRFVVPSEDHKLKKLLLIYWEVVDKTGPDGQLLPEMILVCNNLRNDLNHPNEYIRGCTLRFLCKLREAEILEPLIPTIKANLDHRHSFVRRNAVLAVFSIYQNFDYLIPDGPDLVEQVLLAESDASCKRNAFLMLFHSAQDRAVAFLSDNLDAVAGYGDILQLVVLELIRKIVRANPFEKSKYIRCILTLFNSQSPAVIYECASALVALSTSTTAIRAAANSYTSLLTAQSDNNIKLIVLERLQDLKRQHMKVLQEKEMVMDILRSLSSAIMDIRKKTLDITLELLVPNTVGDVMQVLKKEVVKTGGEEGGDKITEYRAMLIGAIHKAAMKFPESAGLVVPTLMDLLGDEHQSTAIEVVLFLREILESHPPLRESITGKLLSSFPVIHSSRVARVALWLVGEYCVEAAEVAKAFSTLQACLGSASLSPEADAEEETPQPQQQARPLVLPDGSYATQSAMETVAPAAPDMPKLRGVLLGGDYFLATVVGATLTKLALRSRQLLPPATSNLVTADVMLRLVALLQLGSDGPEGSRHIDADSRERISAFLHLLSKPQADVFDMCLVDCRAAFASMLAERRADIAETTPDPEAPAEVQRQSDDLINIRQLRGRGLQATSLELEEDDDVGLGTVLGPSKKELDFSSHLKRVTQLTGLSDPVYAEACVMVHSYDVILDVLVINLTQEPMTNLCLELATVGDLRLCERPLAYTLQPSESKHVKANIKVSSTETGIVFGSIVYESAGGASDRNYVVLNDIHIDIMDYIEPATCSDLAFRAMWAEFEWENKVAVNTDIADPKDFLAHVLTTTNMRCLTPSAALSGDSNFLAANLYAKSIFGEDALVNLSVEKRENRKICGYVRIRSKTQGIALSLGDRITLQQKAKPADRAEG